MEQEPKLKALYGENPQIKDLLDSAMRLEDLTRHAGMHAAGVVISEGPLWDNVPVFCPEPDEYVTQYHKDDVEAAGLVKFDFLGLKTLTVLKTAVNLLKQRGIVIDLSAIPLDDALTYEMLGRGETVAVFQVESAGMRKALVEMRADRFEDIIALVALYRPGPMANIPVYCARKHGDEKADYMHPKLEGVLRETQGVIIYQEQVMQIAQILAGYSLGEADLLRRAMGKKKKEEMDQQKARFVSGASERGVDPAQAASIFELVEKFAGYGFNKSHAAAYALISYQTAWLKANAPVEFLAASMSLDISNTDKLAVFYQDARRFKVKVLPPDVNRSGADFDVEDGAVLYALGAVRNVGFAAMQHLVDVRREGGPFRDLFDFVERVDPRQVNKRALENLARAGAFDSLHPNRAQIVAAADLLIAHGQAEASDRNSDQLSLLGGEKTESSRPRLPRTEPWDQIRRLDEELAAVGFYLTGHPLEDMVDVLRRRRTTMVTEAIVQAEAGSEAFRMAGVVRRRQERVQQSGDRFAFVSLSDPTGEYEVLFPPEALRKCRDALEPGKAVLIKVRAKSRDGEVRFFGDDAEPLDKAVEHVAASLRVHLSPHSTEIEALKTRLLGAATQRGGEVVLVAGLGGGREVELKLPGFYSLDAAMRGALKTAPGVAYLEDV
jgi:DNA polymerase-3 subunit alpha